MGLRYAISDMSKANLKKTINEEVISERKLATKASMVRFTVASMIETHGLKVLSTFRLLVIV